MPVGHRAIAELVLQLGDEIELVAEFLVDAAVGLIAAYSSEANEGSTGGLILGTAIFTAGGAFLGAIVGSLFKKEEWVEASNLSLSMDASPESMKLSVWIGRLKPN